MSADYLSDDCCPAVGGQLKNIAMETKRQMQAAELVKRNFSLVLQQEGSYIYGVEPLVTVTGVKMSPDLGQAKIYLSVFNTENKQAVFLEMGRRGYAPASGLSASDTETYSSYPRNLFLPR